MVPHGLENAKVAYQTTIVEKGNWKLVWENNRECYHCSGSHPEICRTSSVAPTINGVARSETDQSLAQHRARREAAGSTSIVLTPGSDRYRGTHSLVSRAHERVNHTLTPNRADRPGTTNGP